MKKNREAGKIHGGERTPSQRVVFMPEDAHSSFLALAGSIKVSPEKKGTSWREIKAATWRLRAASCK